MPMTRYTQCFKAPYYLDSRRVSARDAVRAYNKKNRRTGWLAVAATPSDGGVVNTGRGPVVPFVIKVCVRPPRNRKAKWQR